MKNEARLKIIEVIKAGDKEVLKNFDFLADEFKRKTGRNVVKGCRASVRFMVLTLNYFTTMSEFKFNGRNVHYKYKNELGVQVRIKADGLTDEEALKFLKQKPERISLFSEYPKDWKELIKGDIETEAERIQRLEVEAEAVEVAKAKAEAVNSKTNQSEKVEKQIEEAENEQSDSVNSVVEDIVAAAEAEAIKAAEEATASAGSDNNSLPSKEVLLSMSLTDLRAKWPTVKATSVKTFVEKLLA